MDIKKENREINMCPECGTQFEVDNIKFCAECGASLEGYGEEILAAQACSTQKKAVSIIRIFVFLFVLLAGGFFGLFIAFACNGGAGGSSEMSAEAWGALLLYLLICFSVLYRVVTPSSQ